MHSSHLVFHILTKLLQDLKHQHTTSARLRTRANNLCSADNTVFIVNDSIDLKGIIRHWKHERQRLCLNISKQINTIMKQNTSYMLIQVTEIQKNSQ